MIYLTDTAAKRILEVMNEKGMGSNAAVRFSVKGGGCSGFEMVVDLEPARKFDMARKHDTKHLDKNVRILVDKKSLLFLNDMVVDFEETEFGHRFKYSNPNAKGWCGCGESFSV